MDRAGDAERVPARQLRESIEPSGSWQHGLTAIVLLIWLVVGIIACRLTFRWIRKDT